jgi:hypothetical protein
MVKELKQVLTIFPGESNQTWCFDHIVNLIAKSIIWQFDEVLWELMVLAGDLDQEELATWEGELSEIDGDDDNVDGWVDKQEEMSKMEQKDLDDNIQPIRRVLVKVGKVAL